MKLRSALLIASILSFGLLSACGGESSAGRSFVDSQVAFGESLCACAEALGVPEDDCRAFYVREASSAQIACIDDVLAAQPPAVTESLACYGDASLEGAACVEESATCGNDAIAGCLGVAQAGIEDCEEIPEDVLADIDDCLD